MSKRNVIHRALATHLQANFSQPTKIAWENTKYITTPEEIWFEEIFLPNDTTQATLGTSGTQEDFGLYQINVIVPENTGTIEADNFIDELTSIFKIGTSIIKDGETIYIEKSTPSQGIEQDNWYVIPFTISWSSFMTIN